ncbi:hypothetical protein Pan54_13310 [Rubinisphaera italica]|uniref:Integrase catalytic domain-containing protein n=1 Tax=Rubinisphaera italica TaxID=2527969 RepID=A0A5C5XBR9_9PLAN|nr:hypothetical protein Pan54_13310 [Rubinisphaera italica]
MVAFFQTIKYECLNRFIVFGKQYVDHLVCEFVDHCNRHRSSMVPIVSDRSEG